MGKSSCLTLLTKDRLSRIGPFSAGSSGAMYSPRAMQGGQQQQRSQFIPTQPMIPTGPPTSDRGFQPHNTAGNGAFLQ